jgi:hypothetical protein
VTTVATTARRAVGALEGFLFEPAPPEPRDEPPERPTRPRGDTRGGSGPPVILTTAIGGSGGGTSLGAAVAVAAGGGTGRASALLVDLEPGNRTRGATVLASESARELEDRLGALGGPFEAAAARGHLCYLPLPGVEDPLANVAELVAHELPAAAVIVHLPQELWPRAIRDARLRARSGLLRAELPTDRALAALAVRELHERGLRAKVVSDPLGRVASRRALAGVEPGGAASRRAARLARALVSSQSGQGLPLVLGAAAALIFTALVLTAIGGAITGKARAQRAARPDDPADPEWTTDVLFSYSRDGARRWRTKRIAGPFDLNTAERDGGELFLGDYEGLAGRPHGFAAAFAQASPRAKSGYSDIFFARLRVRR